MVDISAIAGALSAFKAANDIAQAMVGLRDTAAFQTKLIEFQAKIIEANNSAFAAQEERTTLLKQISDLEKKVTDFEAWETEKQRYVLQAVAPGAFAYVLKPDAQPPEEPHWLCAKCYHERKKMILQKIEHGRECTWGCPTCRAFILVNYMTLPGHKAVE